MSTVDTNNASSIYQAINKANQSGSSSSSSATSSSASDTNDMFMKLLVAQLKNQDPTSPTDTSQYMNQMAQMTQVESTLSLSDSLQKLSSSMITSQQALQASSMVGRNVFVPSDTAELGSSGTIDGAYSLDTSASSVRYSVYDSNGNLVDRKMLGAQTSGNQNFTWDGSGKAAGTYTIKVEADTGNGYQDVQAYLPQKVNSVTLGTGGSSSTINTNIGQFSMGDVFQIG